jgi:putative copper resistance protein D
VIPDLWAVAAIATKFLLYLSILSAAGPVLTSLVFGLTHYRTRALSNAMLALVMAGLVFQLRGANLTGDASGLTD